MTSPQKLDVRIGINPISWTNDDLPVDPEQWRAAAVEHKESWWDDWARWIAERAGGRVAPPKMGGTEHPPLADAPGTYVRS